MASITGSRFRIAFIDDDAFTLAAIRRTMRPLTQEYDVEFHGGSQQFTQGLGQLAPDLVVSDSQMPHLSGWQLLDSIATCHPSTVRVLASGDCPQLDDVLSFSAHQCRIKPCSAASLTELVHDLELYHEHLPTKLTRRLGSLICPTLLPSSTRSTSTNATWHDRLARDLGAVVLLSRVWGQLSASSLAAYSIDQLILNLGNSALQRALTTACDRSRSPLVMTDELTSLSREWLGQSTTPIQWSDPDLQDLLGRWTLATLESHFDRVDPQIIGACLVRLWRLSPD